MKRGSRKTAARLFTLALLLVGLLMVFPASALALFGNGGFENGDLSGGWSVSTFLNPGLQGSAPFTGADIVRNAGGTDRTSVLGPFATLSQADANTGNALRYPLAGNYCAVVNFQGSSRNGNTLTQTDTTTASDVKSDGKIHVQFGWAAVVQNPAHADTQQPYVYVAVHDLTKGTLLYESFIFAGSSPIWLNAANSIQYTDWQVIDIAPGSAALDVGDQVQIEVTAAGCSLGGHWGYVYVDHFGSFETVTPHVTVADKTYDGTTAATVTGGSLTGVQGSDDVSLNLSSATAAFDTPTPGVGKTVTVSNLILSGVDADKYILTSYSATTLADIIAASAIAVQAASSDLQPGHTTTVTATATDSSGNPVVGQTLSSDRKSVV